MNVVGSMDVNNVAEDYGLDKAILISTHKVRRPLTLHGKIKAFPRLFFFRLGERRGQRIRIRG